MKSVYKRVSSFLDELKIKGRNKKILLVTHGGVARAIYWYFNGFNYSLSFDCKNCKDCCAYNDNKFMESLDENSRQCR